MDNIPDIDFRCELKKEKGKAKMYLYGTIVDQKPVNFMGEEIEGDYIYPKQIRDMVDEAGNKDIELHINSKGGKVFASVPIRNFLKDIDNKITVYVDGIAASGASVIITAGDEIVMYDNTNLMIHEPRGTFRGTADDMLEAAETLEKINSSVLNSYMNKFKGSKEELKELLSDETWLTAEEAVTLGLADKVLEEEKLENEKVEEAENSIDIKANLLAKFSEDNEPKNQNNSAAKSNLLSKFK